MVRPRLRTAALSLAVALVLVGGLARSAPAASAVPKRVFARFNHAGDDFQEAFYGAVGGNRTGFEAGLRTAERRLKKLSNYRSYLACGDEHCAMPTPSFYTTTVGRVSLRDWVADLAAGRNVTCPMCGGRR